MHSRLSLITAAAVVLLAGVGATQAAPTEDAADNRYRDWISEMKADRRGPFSGIRWFCNDGSVLPPEPYACRPHGGGHQHGEWSQQTRQLREQGYLIATFLSGIDARAAVDDEGFRQLLTQLLIERYLVAADDGWIFRRALFYRGAIQEEEERAGARRLLEELASRSDWLDQDYVLLRTAVRLLPHGEDSPSVQRVRQLSASLSDRDEGFRALRAKIHGSPDAADADRVRGYAAEIGDPARRAEYDELAEEIDAIYRSAPLAATLRTHASRAVGQDVSEMLKEAAAALEADPSNTSHYRVTAGLLAAMRERLGSVAGGAARLELLNLSLDIESEHFRAGAELAGSLGPASRRERAGLLTAAAQAAYGTGLLRPRELQALQPALQELTEPRSIPLPAYVENLRYLGRAPGWAAGNLRFHFDPGVARLTEIERKADLFVPDQLRGSPMLAYSRIIDTLARDADRRAGISHRLFEEEVGVGFRALNPGFKRGTLHADPDMTRVGAFEKDGIYLLPETVAELPPIAGILTAGEGNPISHVQLLARNLGIPNVAVDPSMIERLKKLDGREIVMAVSPGGVVEIAADGPEWDAYFDDQSEGGDVVIRPDLEKLDLSVRDFVNLNELRAADSGRLVGPKAAKLGELRAAFPDQVAPGIAIPFGMFREVVLDRPYAESGQTVFEWMVAGFRRVEGLQPGEQAQAYEALRQQIYALIRDADPGPEFRARLRAAMEQTFGTAEEVGVFIRSDTNVEDLPGFTGAGLNLTLPNVVGFDDIISGLQAVWASPFTQRAFAWRNSHMEGPEHVYPAVLLLKTVPADKSGVMITADIDNGDTGVLSVAVNEGVGGAVEGQAAESLRIDRKSGAARLLSTASAPTRYVPQQEGGIARLPASGADTLLQPDEIRQLIEFAEELPGKFPAILDERGQPAPADVEFAFVDGRLQLLQIRPFLQSHAAKGSTYLVAMEQGLTTSRDAIVELDEVLP